ncbi:MAG: hypothetical protein IPG67_17565 [Acidobacteria bacterium]|nr:hypothetical protein [Acidobacteriota bacterium]
MPTKMTLEIPKFIGRSSTLSTEIESIAFNSSGARVPASVDWKRIYVMRVTDEHTARFHELAVSGATLPEANIYIRVGTKNSQTSLRVIRLANVSVAGLRIFTEGEQIELECSKVTFEDVSTKSSAGWTGF